MNRDAKRILVLSDSHGSSLNGLLMKAETMGRIDAVFHLGDGYGDMEGYLAEFPRLYRVKGNCDFRGGDMEWLVPLFGKRFYLCHGHAFHVKSTLALLKARGTETEADCVLFGHTHEPYNEYDSGRLYLNPGAACEGRFSILRVERGGDLYAEMY